MLSDGKDAEVFLAFAKDYYAQRMMQKRKPCLPVRDDYEQIFGGRSSNVVGTNLTDNMTTRLVHRRRFAPYARILKSEKSSLSEKQASTSYRKGKRKRIAPICVDSGQQGSHGKGTKGGS